MNLIPMARMIRLEESIEGTISTFILNGEVFCTTLEPPDRLNEVSRSSIPAQQYICRRIQSPRHGETFRVIDVPNRTYINFHAGNDVEDTEGCIILGSDSYKLRGDRKLKNSGLTFSRFMTALIGFDEFHLTIIECY